MPLGAGRIQPLLPGSTPDLLIVWQISPTAWLVPQKDWEVLPQNSTRQTSWSLTLQLSLEYGWAACLPGETALCWALWMLWNKEIPRKSVTEKIWKHIPQETEQHFEQDLTVHTKTPPGLLKYIWLPRMDFKMRPFFPFQCFSQYLPLSFHLNSLCRRCQRLTMSTAILHFLILGFRMKSSFAVSGLHSNYFFILLKTGVKSSHLSTSIHLL